jgi:hypothetical protein
MSNGFFVKVLRVGFFRMWPVFVLELPGFGLACAEASAEVFAAIRKVGRFWVPRKDKSKIKKLNNTL